MRIYGVDFTCAPRKAKPITAASARLVTKTLLIEEIERLESFRAFEALLARPGPWIGGFDLPFSLPAELVKDLGWPGQWNRLVAHCGSLSRQEFRGALDVYRATRPAGNKYAHRATDRPAGSSSPMKLVNPPVALMFHEAAPRLLAAGVHVPALADGDRSRVALEAYPGLLVRRQLGIRDAYKSDTRREHTPARKRVRKKILSQLLAGRPLATRIQMTESTRKTILADGSGDSLDAVICAAQAAWAATRPAYGLPREAFSGEGWIVSAGVTL